MTTKSSQRPTMIDRADTETTLYRVAICAFTYYPGKEIDEPGYSVDEDIAWCTAPLAGLPDSRLGELSNTIGSLITSPCVDRKPFIVALAQLADKAK